MNYRWFISRTVRHASAMRKHVRHILDAQRDLLSPQAIEAVAAAIAGLDQAIRTQLKPAELQIEMKKLDEAADKWLKKYPHPGYRENVEVFLVALAVAMGIRTFFVQPFKIPTGSMQPTLFGITSQPDFSKVRSEADVAAQLKIREELTPASGLGAVRDWFGGVTYLSHQAEEAGEYNGMSRPLRFLLFNLKQTLWVAGKPHNMWFPPDAGIGLNHASGGVGGFVSALFSPLPIDRSAPTGLEQRMGLRRGQFLEKGQDVLKLKVIAGDHLFVDRLTYNFRKPHRGEIAVFQTKGINPELMPQDQFYIKRLVALGGETVQIGNDRHLVINGQRLDQKTPRFERVYSFDPNEPPAESQFSGHVNDYVCAQLYGRGGLAPLFRDGTESQTLAPNHYMVMGDNTMNSKDSREWGSFPGTNIIGKQFFVYWPLTERFGWRNR
jgi:signal peptidase I